MGQAAGEELLFLIRMSRQKEITLSNHRVAV